MLMNTSLLKDLFYKFMNEYAEELNDARKTQNYKRSFGSLVRKDIATSIGNMIQELQNLLKEGFILYIF